MAQVLCTGVDSSLLRTRKMMLEQAGHAVVTVTSDIELQQACAAHSFDVAVIGQNLSSGQKRHFFDLLRKHCPAAKVLELYSPYDRAELAAEDALCVPADVPHDFIERVEKLAPEKKRRKNS